MGEKSEGTRFQTSLFTLHSSSLDPMQPSAVHAVLRMGTMDLLFLQQRPLFNLAERDASCQQNFDVVVHRAKRDRHFIR